jgi:outer membrane protein TolC
MKTIVFLCALVGLLATGPLAAQSPAPDLLLRGVPTGVSSGTPLSLTLADAVTRGLEHNLGTLTQAQHVRTAEGDRWRALSDLLPHVSVNLRQSEQVVNIAAFGFTGFPGIPDLIGPFGLFDARVAVSAPLIDAGAVSSLREERARLLAEQYGYKNTRQWVVLVVANLYFEAVADASRARAAASLVSTAEALAGLAEDQRASGLIAGVELLRQQVQLAAARQRLIASQNAAEKDKLKLARAIGLPAEQTFDLADAIPYAPAPSLTIAQATEQAYATRDDLRGAKARVDAARAARQAAVDGALPTVRVDADYGALGPTISTTKRTFAVAASVHVPLFQGGSTRGKVEQADAELRQREAELADLKAGVQYEVAAAMLDLNAAGAAVDVARSAEALARQQLEQTQDRFRAGVANTIELVQGQDAVATASDNYISSLYAHNLAKASLARALGVVEARFSEFVGGQR